MTVRNIVRRPNLLMLIGLLVLAFASFANVSLHPTARLGPSMVDGLKGLLYGLAIGLLLLSLRGRRKRSSSCA